MVALPSPQIAHRILELKISISCSQSDWRLSLSVALPCLSFPRWNVSTSTRMNICNHVGKTTPNDWNYYHCEGSLLVQGIRTTYHTRFTRVHRGKSDGRVARSSESSVGAAPPIETKAMNRVEMMPSKTSAAMMTVMIRKLMRGKKF